MATFLIDVDGVCANFTDHLLRAVGSKLTLADIVDWDIFSYLSAEKKRVAEEVLSHAAFWLTQPVIPGAVSAVHAIRAADHEVLFVTSAWENCREWAWARKVWLKRIMGAHYRDVIICSRKEFVVGDVIIDDRTDHVENWSSRHPEGLALLYGAPYNKGSFDWSQIGSVLEGL